MSRAAQLEAVGTVVMAAFVIALPMGALFGIYVEGFLLPWWLSLLALTPGTILGYIATTDARLSGTHLWRFGVAHWLTAVVLWQGLAIETPGQESLALGAWMGAAGIGVLAATADWWLGRWQNKQ